MQANSTSFLQLFFSFEGRISRSTYWLKFSIPVTLSMMFVAILDISNGLSTDEFRISWYSRVISGLLLYPSLAVYIKRSHDRNRSAWFVLLLYVPMVNLWPLIELSFLRGTKGPNRFGQDPLGGVGETEQSHWQENPTFGKQDPILNELVNYNGVEVAKGWPEQIKAAQLITTDTIAGVSYPRIPYGSETEDRGADKFPCSDCAVVKGQLHVPNCDLEQCAGCGEQAISCGCEFDNDDDESE